MRSALIPIAGLDESDIARWRELSARAAEPNPFFEPELTLPAAQLLAGRTAVLIAVDGSGDWAGCMPVRRGIRWREVPAPALAAWRHLYCFLGTPLVAAGHEDEVLEAWIGEGGPSRRPFLGIDRIGADGPVFAALERAAATTGTPLVRYETYTRATLDRDRDGAALGVNTKHRRELNRLWRRLSEHLDGELEVTDRAGEEAAIEDFLRIEASGWKGREGTAFACDPGHAEFFRRLCRAFAAEGRLEMLSLQAGERVVAMKCNIRAGAGLFGFKIGYDEDLGSFSPGIHLEQFSIEKLNDAPPDLKWFDTCADPDNRMSKRVWPDRRTIGAVAIPARGVSGGLGRLALRAGAKVNERRKGTDDADT